MEIGHRVFEFAPRAVYHNKSRKMRVLFNVTPVEQALDSLLAYTYPVIDLSPTIRIPNATSRASRIGEMTAMLRVIDETHDAVTRSETRIVQLVFSLRQRRAAVITAAAPVTGLPTELVRKIFLHVAESDKSSKARIVLSHVSSSWRSISLGLSDSRNSGR